MTTTTSQNLHPETLQAFGGDELRARVFAEKYALRGPSGEPVETTPEQMWERVARGVASVEPDPERRAVWHERFLWLLSGFRFIPGGRILHAVGRAEMGIKAVPINCFVIPIRDDSIAAIYECAKEMALTYARGGGCGVDISVLRPKGAPVHNAARTSTGAVSFMETFSLVTGTIGMEGRRGALMLTIADDHPDVLDFCRVKRNLTSVRYANISVRISDAFMKAVEADGQWLLRFHNEADGIHVERTIRARELWEELVEGAARWAEPGCIFWDTMKRYSTTEYNGMGVITTNPCSEQGLDAYNNCCLGSLNLLAFVRTPFAPLPPHENLEWEALRTAVRYAVRFLDNVQTYAQPLFPLPQQREKSEATRRVGLGITALGDMLVALGLRYDSDEAIAFTEKLVEFIKLEAYRASVRLAREKGPFPLFDADRHLSQPFFATFPGELLDEIRDHGLRNAALMTVPPVGSGAALAGVSSGIEPIFQLYYIRRSESLSREYFTVLHPLAARFAEQNGVRLDGLGSAREPAAYLRDRLPAQFVTAHEIDWHKRVEMQAAIQRHVDNAISSTINLPRGTPAETVGRLYHEAWRAGLKGVTVYVEGSREGVLITPEEARRRDTAVRLADRVDELARTALPDLARNGAASPEERVEHTVRALVNALQRVRSRAPEQLELVADDGSLLRDRPRRLDGPTYRIPSQFGTLFLTITERDGEPYELFIRLGKAGSDTEAAAEAIGRLSSVILRMKGPGPGSRRLLDLVYHQLEGIGGRTSYGFGPNRIRSVPDAIAAGIRAYLQDRGLLNGNGADHAAEHDTGSQPPAGRTAGDICPRCHEMTLVTDNGCAKCPCGYREC